MTTIISDYRNNCGEGLESGIGDGGYSYDGWGDGDVGNSCGDGTGTGHDIAFRPFIEGGEP